jgi:hypothetical protein
MDRNSRLHRFFGTDSRAGDEPTEPVRAPALSDLVAIRQAMLLSLEGCSEPHRLRACAQIERTSSVTQLWLMRADIFQYLAMDFGEMAAASRIAALVPVFKDLLPAVAAPALCRDNRLHDAMH